MSKTGQTEPVDRPARRISSFKGDVLRLVSGTFFSQLILLLTAPVITRFFAPEAFGVTALFFSLTGILGVLSCMRYELSVVLPESDREAANLLGVCLTFTPLVALLTIPFVWFAGEQISRWANRPELIFYLWLLPIVLLIQGLYTALNYWNTRTKHYARLSVSKVIRSLISVSGMLGAGFAGQATGGAMIAARIGGQTIATGLLAGLVLRESGRFLFQTIRLREMFAGLVRYKKFPLYSSWAALFNSMSMQLPVLLLGVFFNPESVGFYALGHQLLTMPMTLVGSSIGQVFFQRASVARADGTLAQLVGEVIQRLLQMATFPFLLLMIVGPELFSVFFGANWETAGVFAQILAPWLFLVFLGSPISVLSSVLEVQQASLALNVVLLMTRTISLVVGGLLNDVVLALMLFSTSGAVVWAVFIWYLSSRAGVHAPQILKPSVRHLLASVAFLLPVVTLKWLTGAGALLTLATASLASVLYFLFAFTQDPQLRAMGLATVNRIRK